MKKDTIILASASPRRRELLKQVGLEFIVIPSSCEETRTETEPSLLVESLALQKAEDVYHKIKKGQLPEGEAFHDLSQKTDYIIIGADTLVAKGKTVLGKPEDEEDAFRMLSFLQGTSHQVYSGVAILSVKNNICHTKQFHVKTDVAVFPMTRQQIRDYIATGEPMDKAGAYGIQGRFAEHIKEIHGDYYNVVGLPVSRVMQNLQGSVPTLP